MRDLLALLIYLLIVACLVAPHHVGVWIGKVRAGIVAEQLR